MTEADFRALCLADPEAIEGFNMGSAFVKVNGKDLVRVLGNGMGMLTGISPEETELLLDMEPEVFESDAHYKGGRCIRVRLEATTAEHMHGFLERRFRQIAKKAVVKAYDAGA